MSSAFDIFSQLSKIPHKSYHTQEMFAFLCGFCVDLGYEVRNDAVGNIYASKSSTPRICLQAHYDMVGVGAADRGEPLEIFLEGQYLRAKDSSLGADNGAAVAAMLYLMQKYDDIEFLFTNNEEVGLDGANGLEIPIRSRFLLNLDSEFFGEIILGCAGGFDAKFAFAMMQVYQATHYYSIEAFGFSGGHSGVDIHKNIASSIVEFCKLIAHCDCQIYSLEAGEKSNSIPTKLRAILGSKQNLESLYKTMATHSMQIERGEDFVKIYIGKNEGFSLKDISNTEDSKILKSKKPYNKNLFVELILALKHGAIATNNHQVVSSLNIAIIENLESTLHITLKARANTKELLQANKEHIAQIVDSLIGESHLCFDNFYSPWARELEENHPILELIRKSFDWRAFEIGEIHAGLECGILQGRFEQMGLEKILMASIGPTILNPHSLKEKMDFGSFEEFLKVLENIIKGV